MITRLFLIKSLAFLAFLITVSSCSRVQYVPIEKVRTDSTYIYQFLRDSVYVQDSVYVREKGDTVYLDKVKKIYKEKTVRDTFYISRVDTIRVPYPVERKLSKWEEAYLVIGRVSFWVGAVAVVVIFIFLGSKLYKLFK